MPIYINDTARGGMYPFRDHTLEVTPDFKTRHGLTITNLRDDTGTSEENDIENAGDWTCWQFWENDSNAASIDFPQGEQIQGSTDFTRQIEPSDYMRQGLPFEAQESTKRNLGSWAQCVPCAVTEENEIKPIHSKTGGVDKDYKGKKLLTTGFSGDTVAEAKPIHGAKVAKGIPGVCVQTINHEKYDQVFVPTGGLLNVDHKTDDGLSVRVYDTKDDGFIDVDNKEAAGLHSAWKIFKDEQNRKTIAITGNKSGKDDTGHGAIVLDPRFGQDDSVPQGVDLGKLCYLDHTKGGPFCAGSPSNDSHKIGQNAEGKEVVPAHIATDTAKFFKSPTKDGEILFSDKAFPVIDGVTAIESDIIFDPNSKKWRIITLLEEQENQLKFARIRWNFDNVSGGTFADLSEAEIVDSAGNSVETPEIVWIDYRQSSGVFFNTFGNGAIFVVRKIASGIIRDGSTRDLYRAESVLRDEGTPIKYIELNDKQNLVGTVLSGDQPWADPQNSIVKTQIGQADKDNKIVVKIPSQWDLEDPNADYKFLEASDLSRGIDIFFSPICPTPTDGEFFDTGKMESLERIGESAIATYKQKVT